MEKMIEARHFVCEILEDSEEGYGFGMAFEHMLIGLGYKMEYVNNFSAANNIYRGYKVARSGIIFNARTVEGVNSEKQDEYFLEINRFPDTVIDSIKYDIHKGKASFYYEASYVIDPYFDINGNKTVQYTNWNAEHDCELWFFKI